VGSQRLAHRGVRGGGNGAAPTATASNRAICMIILQIELQELEDATITLMMAKQTTQEPLRTAVCRALCVAKFSPRKNIVPSLRR
jgi:hypothetical protein